MYISENIFAINNNKMSISLAVYHFWFWPNLGENSELCAAIKMFLK